MNTFWNYDNFARSQLSLGALMFGDSWLWFPFGNLSRCLEPILLPTQATLVIGANGMRIKHIELYYNQVKCIAHTFKTIDYILISLGGNDFVGGNLYKFLNVNCSDARYVGECLNLENMEFYVREIAIVVAGFARRISFVTDSKKLNLIIQGYDYPQASGRGWFGMHDKISGPLNHCQVPKHLQSDLIKLVVDTYNFWLQNYISDFTYINLRGATKNKPWMDEIHPTASQFGQLSVKIREQMG